MRLHYAAKVTVSSGMIMARSEVMGSSWSITVVHTKELKKVYVSWRVYLINMNRPECLQKLNVTNTSPIFKVKYTTLDTSTALWQGFYNERLLHTASSGLRKAHITRTKDVRDVWTPSNAWLKSSI